MEQQIRFREVDGHRVAFATVGEGPPLVLPAYWGSHLELEWTFPEYRAFVSALAEDRTVIRYDRLGTGLSDRVRPDSPDVEAELRTLEAVVGDRRPVSLLGISWGACVAAAYAARRPVETLAVVGGFANGSDAAPAALREAILATVRAHWGTGSRLLADVWVPGTDAATRDAFATLQRAAADAETAAVMLEAIYATDIRGLLGDVKAPTLVVHRRDDRAIPFELGRDLAARIPGARLVALEGDIHLPWLGDRDSVLRALAGQQAAPVVDGPLSTREQEVLRLIADGLSDADIAERLIVSPHTVHRHVANIRTKLRQPSRAAAAAHAVREGLI
jgi:pimeloyl-ACP methyl ester carboxylesterase